MPDDEKQEELATELFPKAKPINNRMFEKSEPLGRKDDENEDLIK